MSLLTAATVLTFLVTHCVKSVQIGSFFWSEYRKIRTRKNSFFGHFSRCDAVHVFHNLFWGICRLFGQLFITCLKCSKASFLSSCYSERMCWGRGWSRTTNFSTFLQLSCSNFSLKFWNFPDISLFPKSEVVLQLVRQLLYTIFIINNHASFHLWSIKDFFGKVNVTKSEVSCGFGHIYWRNP